MITINGRKCRGFTSSQLAEIPAVQDRLNKVMGSAPFKREVLAAKFKETGGKTNEEIYEITQRDYEICLYRYSKLWSKVVGWVTGPGATIVHVNKKYWDANTVEEKANNIAHEFMHTQGFYHSIKPWFDSVPYYMNRIFRVAAEELGLL